MSLNDIWGEPTEFNGLKIYPVKLVDSDYFYGNVGVLLINKNRIPDKDIIKMSYLLYLFIFGLQFSEIKDCLMNILRLVLKTENVEFKFTEQEAIYLQVDDQTINERDFDVIRKIILYQNMVPFDENLLDAEMERRLREAEEFLSKKNGIAPSLEDKIVSYHCLTGIDYKIIKDYTIYQFNKGIERLVMIKDFEVYTYPLLKCGEGDKVKSWLTHIEERGMYDHVLMSKEEFDRKTNDSSFKKM